MKLMNGRRKGKNTNQERYNKPLGKEIRNRCNEAQEVFLVEKFG